MRHSSRQNSPTKVSNADALAEGNKRYCEPPRKWCTLACKEKALFPNYTAALNFLQDYNGFLHDGGPYACSVYMCRACGGWHLTHHIPETQWIKTAAEGIFVNGVLYRAMKTEAKVNTCMLCDEFILKRCRVTGIMPCLAYKGDNIYFKKQDRLAVVRSIMPE